MEITTTDISGPVVPFVLEDLWVHPCSFNDVRGFVEKYHYSQSVKGITPSYCFEVVLRFDRSRQVGAAIFGKPGQVQTEDRYGVRIADDPPGTRCWQYKLVELRRLVLLDEAPKNSETKVLGVMLRELKKAGVQRVLSYADPNEERLFHPDGKHTGLIYRAAGFHCVKEAGKTKAIRWKGRRYPIRNIDQYNNYHSEPDGVTVGKKAWSEIPDDKKILREERYGKGRRLVWVPKIEEERIGINKQLRAALDSGEAVFIQEEGKIGYVKDLVSGMPHFETPRKHE